MACMKRHASTLRISVLDIHSRHLVNTFGVTGRPSISTSWVKKYSLMMLPIIILKELNKEMNINWTQTRHFQPVSTSQPQL